jgi:hydrogenase expression/formation protein HypE
VVFFGLGFETTMPSTALTVLQAEKEGIENFSIFYPLYLANEGKIVAVVPEADAERALEALKSHPLGAGASRIGRIVDDQPGRVLMKTVFGGRRIVDMLVGEQLPRIC